MFEHIKRLQSERNRFTEFHKELLFSGFLDHYHVLGLKTQHEMLFANPFSVI